MQKIGIPFHCIGFAARSFFEKLPAFEALGAKLIHKFTDQDRNLDFLF